MNNLFAKRGQLHRVLLSKVGQIKVGYLLRGFRIRAQRREVVENPLYAPLGAKFFERLTRFAHWDVDGSLVGADSQEPKLSQRAQNYRFILEPGESLSMASVMAPDAGAGDL
jgi:hypothetical protein